MLYIRTGLMGHGKTLNTIKEVDLKAYAEGRTVYYHNVTDLDASKLTADWFPFDQPRLWFDLPDNAIIVIDEAQGSAEVPMFGVRDPRQVVPPHASNFEIMRKKGHEVHLITQDPRFIDVHVRRLCNKHIHYWRIFGSTKVARYELERCFNDVEKFSTNKDATRTIIGLDKKYFGVYSSAKAGHHFKFRPSKKAVFFFCALLVTIWLGYRVYDRLYNHDEPSQLSSESSAASVVSTARSLISGSDEPKGPISAAAYTSMRKPRVDPLPATAPVYDELTKPKAYPKLYCASSSDPKIYAKSFADMPSAVVNGVPTVCQCYTQQATRIKTDFAFCSNVVAYGYFDASIADRGRSQDSSRDISQRPMQQPGVSQNGQSLQPSTSGQQAGLTIVPYERGRFLW